MFVCVTIYKKNEKRTVFVKGSLYCIIPCYMKKSLFFYTPLGNIPVRNIKYDEMKHISLA